MRKTWKKFKNSNFVAGLSGSTPFVATIMVGVVGTSLAGLVGGAALLLAGGVVTATCSTAAFVMSASGKPKSFQAGVLAAGMLATTPFVGATYQLCNDIERYRPDRINNVKLTTEFGSKAIGIQGQPNADKAKPETKALPAPKSAP